MVHAGVTPVVALSAGDVALLGGNARRCKPLAERRQEQGLTVWSGSRTKVSVVTSSMVASKMSALVRVA